MPLPAATTLPRTEAESPDSAYWDAVGVASAGGPTYLDPFMARLKRREYLRLIRRWGGIPPNGVVLKTDLFEESHGSDRLLPSLCSGRLAVGMDLSTEISSQAQRRDAPRRARYVSGDARRLPFADNSFDVVISPSTLDHFADNTDLGRSLGEIRRILRPGGALIITLDNRGNVFDPLLRLAHWAGFVPYHLGRGYTTRELGRELRSAGFNVKAETAILHAPRLVPVLCFMLARRLKSERLHRSIRRWLLRAQRLENTSFRRLTGAFVAAWAEPAK
ncbi:MAG: class I SAM-dependent methyltransferase [Bryobacteraceae bacterium]|nr:class I SAM-dependent methyltransferase [Bryobacteraceae bacterium]